MNLLKSISLWGISNNVNPPLTSFERVSEVYFLRKMLLELSIDCVLDVGANRGQFASELRGIGYLGSIISFEPIPSEFAVMRESFKSDPQWAGHAIALGSKTSSMTITIPKLTVMSSLLESTTPESNTRQEVIEVKRLDEVFHEIVTKKGYKNVLLKMDTQGYDLEVFKGASGCLENIAAVQSELSVRPLYKNMPHYVESLETYENAGFDLYNLSVVNRVEDGGLLELNCFMRRAK